MIAILSRKDRTDRKGEFNATETIKVILYGLLFAIAALAAFSVLTKLFPPLFTFTNEFAECIKHPVGCFIERTIG